MAGWGSDFQARWKGNATFISSDVWLHNSRGYGRCSVPPVVRHYAWWRAARNEHAHATIASSQHFTLTNLHLAVLWLFKIPYL